MTIQLKCKICKCIICEDVNKIDRTQKYLECPVCRRIMENPYYENKT
jgi:hypothetical protein